MKNLLTALILAALVLPASAAAFKHPGFTTKDLAKIEEALSNAQSPRQKTTCMILKNLAQNQYPTLADFSKMVDTVMAETYVNQKNMLKADAIFHKKQFILSRGEYTNEFWAFSKENPDFYDFYTCGSKNFRKKYQISDKDCYDTFVRCMVDKPQAYGTKAVIAALDELKTLAGDAISTQQQAADLTKIKAAYQKRNNTEVVSKIDALLAALQ